VGWVVSQTRLEILKSRKERKKQNRQKRTREGEVWDEDDGDVRERSDCS
jgi:hypothetical protein